MPPDPKVVGTESAGQQQLQGGLLELLGPLLRNPGDAGSNPFIGGLGGENQNVSGAAEALMQILSGGPEGLLRAAQPVFQENFQFGLGQLGAAAPTTRGSAFGNQAIDFATRQDNAFNLFAESALQNFQGNQIQAANQLGGIGLQQQANQLNPTLQLILGALGQSFPNSQVVQPAGILDFAGAALPIAATAFGGPAAGAVVGSLGPTDFI